MTEPASKLCAFEECGKVMHRENYVNNREFDLVRFCSSACNHRSRSPCDWQAIMAFEVIEGVELSYAEISAIGHVSRQACQQLVDHALEKLSRNPRMRLIADELHITEWRCAK